MRIEISPAAQALGLQGCVAARITELSVMDDNGAVYRAAMEKRLAELALCNDSFVTRPEVAGYELQLAHMGYPKTEPANLRLLRSCLERGVNSVFNVVDAYNLVALKHGASFGVHDAQKMADVITVDLANADEKILPLFSKRSKNLANGDLVYRSKGNVMAAIGSRDCDSDEFKITPSTTEVFAMILGHKDTSVSHNRAVIEDYFAALQQTCPNALLSWVDVAFQEVPLPI